MATILRIAASVQRWSSTGRGRARICQVSSRCWPRTMRSSGGAARTATRASRSLQPSAATTRAARGRAGHQGDRVRTSGLLQKLEGLAAEDVGMPGELEESDSGVEVDA